MLIVKETNKANSTQITYLNFDVSSIDGTITLAKLHFTGSAQPGFELDVYGTADSWSESTITWNNAPAVTTNLGSIAVNGSSFFTYEINVTDYVETERGLDGSVSIVLKDDAKTKRNLDIRSKESGVDIAYLEIEYNQANSRVVGESTQLEMDKLDSPTFSLYPNPVSDGLLTLSAPYEISSVKILSINGQVTEFMEHVNSNRIEIETQRWTKGLYFVQVSSAEGMSIQKVVKK